MFGSVYIAARKKHSLLLIANRLFSGASSSSKVVFTEPPYVYARIGFRLHLTVGRGTLWPVDGVNNGFAKDFSLG